MPPRRSAADNAFTVPPTAITMAASCREPCLQDSGAHSRRQERKTSDQERKQQLTGSDSHTHAPCLGNRAPSTERNQADTYGINPATPSAGPWPGPRSASISALISTRSAVRNGHRPAAATTSGSTGASSVHSVGILARPPDPSR
jgi:hypothetical protein